MSTSLSLTCGDPDGVVTSLDARRHVCHGLQPAGALAIHRAERDSVGDAGADLRDAARQSAGARLQDVAYANLEWRDYHRGGAGWHGRRGALLLLVECIMYAVYRSR